MIRMLNRPQEVPAPLVLDQGQDWSQPGQSQPPPDWIYNPHLPPLSPHAQPLPGTLLDLGSELAPCTACSPKAHWPSRQSCQLPRLQAFIRAREACPLQLAGLPGPHWSPRPPVTGPLSCSCVPRTARAWEGDTAKRPLTPKSPSQPWKAGGCALCHFSGRKTGPRGSTAQQGCKSSQLQHSWELRRLGPGA